MQFQSMDDVDDGWMTSGAAAEIDENCLTLFFSILQINGHKLKSILNERKFAFFSRTHLCTDAKRIKLDERSLYDCRCVLCRYIEN